MLYLAVDVPSWADKLEAWASLFAAIFSAAAFIIALYVLRREQRTRHDDKVEAEAAQARMVYAGATDPLGGPDEGWTGVRVVAHNNSKTRITRVWIEAEPRGMGICGYRLQVSDMPGDVSDGREIMFDQKVPWPFGDGSWTPAELMRRAVVWVYFVDSEGRGWRREDRKDPMPARIRATLPGAWRMLAEYVGLLPMLRRIGHFFSPGPRQLREWLWPRIAKRYEDDYRDPA